MRLIDADVLEEITDDRYTLGEIGRREHDDIVDALRFAPTIGSEQRSACEIKELVEECDDCGFCGRWLEKNIVRMNDELDDSNVIDEWQSARCSKCGKYHTTPFRYSFDHYEFCPHCGKPMKE